MDMSKGEKGGGIRSIPAPAPEGTRDVPAIVGSNLRRLRKARSYSLEKLSELSGVSRAMLGQIETGKSVPTVSLLWKVADALAVSVGTLMTTEDAAAPVVFRASHVADDQSEVPLLTKRPMFPRDRLAGGGLFELRVAPRHREIVADSAAGMQINLVVVRGTLSIAVAEKSAARLGPGDAIVFEAGNHAYENLGDTEVLAYFVESNCARNS